MNLRALLDEHVTPLQRKVRGRVLDDLAARLRRLEPGEADLPEPLRLATLAVCAAQVVQQVEDDLLVLDRRFAAFRAAYLLRSDDRRDLLIDHLTETVADPAARRADIRALSRYLDFDGLRERHTVRRHRLLVIIEIALTFIGRAAAASLAHRHGRRAEESSELFEAGRIHELLTVRAEKGARWQVRHAAIDALCRILRAVRQTGSTEAFEDTSLGAAVRIAGNRDEDPFVQGAALELAALLSPRFADSLLAGRLFDLPANLPRHDFLVRRQSVDLLGRQGAVPLLEKVVRAHDPSEHVRLGAALALGQNRGAGAGGIRALRLLARDESPKVRAQALIAAAGAPEGVDLLVDRLAEETEPLPLRAACAEAVRVVELVPDAGPRLLASLVDVSARPGCAPSVHEAAADAAETIARRLDPARSAWTTWLGAVASAIPPGGRRVVDLAALPAGLPPLPADPSFLGRVLGELARHDFGLAAARTGDALSLWRGDQLGRRFWRFLHELRHPAPNKRQAVSHVIGRIPRGTLRAPPGGLDEVTATVVPGERVRVDTEGSWGGICRRWMTSFRSAPSRCGSFPASARRPSPGRPAGATG